MNVAAICVAIALVAALVVHVCFGLAGAFAAIFVLVSGAWPREVFRSRWVEGHNDVWGRSNTPRLSVSSAMMLR
ncbi:UNVERIFIED_CONTAM: hypothetical protein DES50_10533 [Williamsia faeni]